jgi:hypothetical protein
MFHSLLRGGVPDERREIGTTTARTEDTIRAHRDAKSSQYYKCRERASKRRVKFRKYGKDCMINASRPRDLHASVALSSSISERHPRSQTLDERHEKLLRRQNLVTESEQ